MRIWFGHDTDGLLRSMELHEGGWNTSLDFNTSAHPTMSSVRPVRAALGITSFIAFDCSCPPSETKNCVCHNKKFAESYVKDGKLVTKPSSYVRINGEGRFVGTQNRVVVPSADFSAQLFVESDVPDGSTVIMGVGGFIERGQRTLVLTGNQSSAVVVGRANLATQVAISFYGKYVVPITLQVAAI